METTKQRNSTGKSKDIEPYHEPESIQHKVMPFRSLIDNFLTYGLISSL